MTLLDAEGSSNSKTSCSLSSEPPVLEDRDKEWNEAPVIQEVLLYHWPIVPLRCIQAYGPVGSVQGY